MTETSIPFKPCIIVHGGAGNVSMSKRKPALDTVKEAAKIGYHVLLEGRSALDAVEAATRNMEDSGLLNAGCGGYLTEEGTIELDAMIMDGETLNTGAVVCVQNIANPISLARKVMTNTPHCMLAAEGALKFARNKGFPVLEDSSSLISDHSYKMYIEEKLKREKLNKATDSDTTGTANEDVLQKRSNGQPEHDTVGAVAMDTSGRIAVSSSTGGTPYKMCGRVGDSPLIGSGAYANHQAGASCTGDGESILKVLLAREVVYNVENGLTPRNACRKAISKMSELTSGKGGVICLDKSGTFGVEFNTREMAWAAITAGHEIKYGIDPGKERAGQI